MWDVTRSRAALDPTSQRPKDDRGPLPLATILQRAATTSSSQKSPRSVDAAERQPLAAAEEEDGNRLSEDESAPRKPEVVSTPKRKGPEGGSPLLLAFCFFGLQISYLTWGYVQEKVMTTEYTTGKFPSATFCVFSNRLIAIIVALAAMLYQHGSARVPAPLWAFAPCSLSNSLSSYAQYQALRYVSFSLQTLSKSTKVIPVMLMGKLLNKKSYPWRDYGEAALISIGVSLFSFSESKPKGSHTTELLGVLLLVMYVTADSFTSQWQSRVYKANPNVDQFQMMFAVNMWSLAMTLITLVASSELFVSLKFLSDNPAAITDQMIISATSATGQLFIYFTIRRFGPITFTIIMTTRQIFSMVLSAFAFGHTIHALGGVGALTVFAVVFVRARRGGGD